VWLYTLVCLSFISLFLFLLIFLRIIRICMARIWMDKNSTTNHSRFYFQTKAIKLALQLSQYFFIYAVINNYFSEWTNCNIVWYVVRKIKKFPERNSINTLFLNFKFRKTISCCKTSILSMIITSASICLLKLFC